jgi:hypothetical protein
MKRFFVTVLCCLVIGSFLTACTAATPDKKGASTKMGKPRPAQEQVVPDQGK